MSRTSALTVLAGMGLAGVAIADEQVARARVVEPCEYLSPQQWQSELWAAVARGEIDKPVINDRPDPLDPLGPGAPGTPSCVTPAQFFLYEDTNGVLDTNFSNGQMFALMIDAANEVQAEHGDQFDFVGFWLNFDPHHLIGAAFYAGFENDVSGIGQGPFNFRASNGLNGDNIEGFIMMWNLNTSWWATGTGPNADFTRLALAQEFEHRFAMFLPPLPNGLPLQGTSGCGRQAHWNWRVDGQGSGMEISEWVGQNPAVLQDSFISFNTDIAGSVWSYTDLYLMGYVSPSEMDAGNSQLRYMVNSDCTSDFFGAITPFTSTDIIASAGPRIPDSTQAQKHFRTAWIIIHRPGDEPTSAELQRTTDILNQHTTDWDLSTLGRGTMDNTLFDDLNCDGLPDCAADLSGSSDPNNPAFGIPDGVVDANDFFYYLDRFAAGDLGVADLTGSVDPNDPGFGVPDGVLDANDFFFYLTLFALGCP